jgi:predicted DNA-binding transcriptional regulator YafY
LPTETGQPVAGSDENVAGMRTDRLVAIPLLLQQREQVTAAEAARELGVSERTARRDLDALAVAGVPGPNVRG